ncbi:MULTISPECIES: type II secretion system protein GspK [unclassified Pseudoalteromonas]|uniref:general secretion pathway protein GspK n=1 Tax=unclassified Pseudoalteromonas TaxID=194690 RepID=UPI00140AEA7E|nr:MULTISPECIES: type II secretion system protein GspK [unclassified Pseudoalteromonas]MBH0025410.1 general secretion pathway protein GspK [Pseudoalteromonas sp. SWN29]
MQRSIAGIALVQVLLIVAVLSILALYFTQSARNQVHNATLMVDKAQAYVELHSAEANVLYALLTEPKNPEKSNQVNNQNTSTLINSWNFYGAQFTYNQYVNVALQDLRGLLNLHYPNKQRLRQLLTYSGLNDYDAQLTSQQIIDWQNLDTRSDYIPSTVTARHAAIHDISELKHLGLKPELLNILQANTTQYKKGAFNPMTAPDSLLNALLSSDVAAHVIMLRNAKQLTVQEFAQVTGFSESEDIILYPSNLFKVTLQAHVGDASIKKVIYYHLQPTGKPVVNIVAVKAQ